MAPSAGRRGVLTLLTALVSFRVLVALATSASVTALVAGPMAYQAAKAREVEVVAAPAVTTTTTTTLPDPARPLPPSTTTTSTTTTTTSTTSPEAGPVATSTTTTTPPVTAAGLVVSPWVDHADPQLVEGSRLTGEVWVFFDGSGVTSVSYWLDDATGAGAPDRVAAQPFDLDPEGIDVRTLGLGTHTLLAEVTTIDGTYRRLATFTVVG